MDCPSRTPRTVPLRTPRTTPTAPCIYCHSRPNGPGRVVILSSVTPIAIDKVFRVRMVCLLGAVCLKLVICFLLVIKTLPGVGAEVNKKARNGSLYLFVGNVCSCSCSVNWHRLLPRAAAVAPWFRRGAPSVVWSCATELDPLDLLRRAPSPSGTEQSLGSFSTCLQRLADRRLCA